MSHEAKMIDECNLTMKSSLADMKEFIEKHNLPVARNVGGKEKRTKEHIFQEIMGYVKQGDIRMKDKIQPTNNSSANGAAAASSSSSKPVVASPTKQKQAENLEQEVEQLKTQFYEGTLRLIIRNQKLKVEEDTEELAKQAVEEDISEENLSSWLQKSLKI